MLKMPMHTTLKLLRINQWYKNLLVFLPLVFGLQLADIDALSNTVLAFVSLCFISSANYILNDFVDSSRDKARILKKNYLSSGEISVWSAFALLIIFFSSAVLIASYLSLAFTLFVLALFVLTTLYSFLFKHELFADVILISVNFVIRAVSGAFVISDDTFVPYIWVSPWLIVGVFFLALFLAVGKRAAEVVISKKNLTYRSTLIGYTPELTNALMFISTSVLVMSYALYSFLSIHPTLILTMPFAIYIIFRYLHLIYSGSKIPLENRFYLDSRLLIGIMLWAVVTFLVLYYKFLSF